jgi:hypothetical protein
MKLHRRILGIVMCVLLASGTAAWAAGKHKPGKHGKTTAPARESQSTPGSSDAAATKASGGPSEPRTADTRAPLRESVKQESRIEFDERMLRGQSAAGVIYLFQRTPSDWKSIVEVPDSFRSRTVNVLAPAEEKK